MLLRKLMKAKGKAAPTKDEGEKKKGLALFGPKPPTPKMLRAFGGFGKGGLLDKLKVCVDLFRGLMVKQDGSACGLAAGLDCGNFEQIKTAMKRSEVMPFLYPAGSSSGKKELKRSISPFICQSIHPPLHNPSIVSIFISIHQSIHLSIN